MQVRRPCRSPYLFHLCAEIISFLIRENNDIKGIVILDKEHVLKCCAADTSLVLDCTSYLLFTALDTLDYCFKNSLVKWLQSKNSFDKIKHMFKSVKS